MIRSKKNQNKKQKIKLRFLTNHPEFGEGYEYPEYKITYLDEKNDVIKEQRVDFTVLAFKLLDEKLGAEEKTYSAKFLTGHPEYGEGYGMPEYEIVIKNKDGSIISPKNEKLDKLVFELLEEKYEIVE